MTLPLMLHIGSGTLGMLSGFVTVAFRKGSRNHALAGNVFVVSMLILSSTGMYLAARLHQQGNFLGGAVTFYLVATAWVSARREHEGTNLFDWGALLVIFALAAVELTNGFQAAFSTTGLKDGYPAGPYFMMGTVAVLATVGDIRMLVRGGISGAQRVARHLWRMCFALFIAAMSIFLARQQLFPEIFRRTGALYLLSFLPLILMVFWLIRVRFARAYKRKALVVLGAQHSLSAR